MTKQVIEKKKEKKVEKTAPKKEVVEKSTAKSGTKKNTTIETKPKEIKSNTGSNKTTTASTTTPTKEKEPTLKIINLEDLLGDSANKEEKKISIDTTLKGDKLVQQILSFFELETKNVKLNELLLLENEIKEKSNKIINKVSNNYLMIMEMVNKFLESNEILALVVLLSISGTVSSFNFPELIESLIIKKDNYKLISIVSKCLSEISSDNIKDLIQYILNNKQFKSIKDQLEQQSQPNTNTIIESSIELDSILNIPLNHDSMVVSIRSLSINQVLILLKYLYSRISLFSLTNNTEDQQLNNNYTLKQLIDWISLVFDSHFQELSKVENINQFFGPIRSLHNNTKSFFYTKSFIDFLEKSSSTKSIENNNYSIYHYKF